MTKECLDRSLKGPDLPGNRIQGVACARMDAVADEDIIFRIAINISQILPPTWQWICYFLRISEEVVGNWAEEDGGQCGNAPVAIFLSF